MEKIRLANGDSFELQGYDASATQLNFRLYDADTSIMKALLQNEGNTALIQIVDINEDTLDEKVLAAFKGYTTLGSISTDFAVVTGTDYTVEDDTTESGFAEIKHDISRFSLNKVAKIDAAIASLQESQTIQDGAIDDLGEAVSEIVG